MDSPPSKQTRWFFEEVHAHESSLRAYLRRAFPWLREVDELVQDSLARLWRAGQDGKVDSGRAFLFATARHAALDLCRRNRIVHLEPLTETGDLSVIDDGPGVVEIVSQREELALLADAIRSLPERCRQVLTLRKIYGLPQKQIALELGMSEHTVEVQTANGMRRCAKYLRSHGVEGVKPRGNGSVAHL